MNKSPNYKFSFFGSMLIFVFIDIGVVMGWVTGKAVWLEAIVMLGLAYNLYLSAPRVGLSKLWSALLAGAFYLSFLVVLSGYKFDLKPLAPLALITLKPIPPFALFIAACFLGAVVLVFGFDYALIFDRRADAGYYRLFPFMSKATAAVKQTIFFLFIGVIFSLIGVFLWNWIAGMAGWQIIPNLNLNELRSENPADFSQFWTISSAVVLLITLNGIRRCLTAPRWDVFISYKSKNVDIARAIADRLTASGIRVWFAEYQILLTGRDRFQEAIDRGIRKCTCGIALTNDDYVDSEYCRKEMDQLLEVFPPKNILEIMIPDEPRTHQRYQQLEGAGHYLFSGDVEDMFNFMAQKSGWKIIPRVEIERRGGNDLFSGSLLGQPFTIDVSGWTLVDKSFHGGGPHYLKQVEDREIHWNLQYGEEISREVFEARLSLDHQNDRKLYNNLCDYARRYFSNYQKGVRIMGVHLVLIDGASHFAVTYTDKGSWKRRYSIMLLDPLTKRAAEFVFTFQCIGTFGMYCHAVDVMDDLVLSFKWGDGRAGTPEKAPAAPLSKPSPAVPGIPIPGDLANQAAASRLEAEGLTLAKKGQLAGAIATWGKALELSTEAEARGAILFNLGRAYEKMGDDEEALQCYTQSAETNPAQFNALCNIGSIYMRKGSYREALEYLLKAAECNPGDFNTLYNLTECYDKLGEAGAADQWRRKMQAMQPPSWMQR